MRTTVLFLRSCQDLDNANGRFMERCYRGLSSQTHRSVFTLSLLLRKSASKPYGRGAPFFHASLIAGRVTSRGSAHFVRVRSLLAGSGCFSRVRSLLAVQVTSRASGSGWPVPTRDDFKLLTRPDPLEIKASRPDPTRELLNYFVTICCCFGILLCVKTVGLSERGSSREVVTCPGSGRAILTPTREKWPEPREVT